LAPSHSNTKERISLKEGRFIMNRVDSPTSKKNSSSNSSNTKKTKSSGRRDKLKSLMVERVIQKFKKKHGNVSLDGVALQFVSEQCEKIIMKGAGTENDLQRIVLEMEKFVKRENTPNAKSIESNDNLDVPKLDTEKLSVGSTADSAVNDELDDNLNLSWGSTKKNNKPHEVDFGEDVWAAIAVKEAQLFSEEQRKQHIRAQEKKLKMRAELDSQIQRNREEKLKRLEEEKQILEQQKMEIEKHIQEQERLEKERLERIMQEKLIRQEQMQAANSRRLESKERRRREEERQVEELQKQITYERMREQQKKQKHKEEIINFLSFNEQLKARKAEEAKMEQELDKKLLEESIQRQEVQDRRREEDMRKMYERQSKAFALGHRIHTTLEEKAKEDERKALEEQERITRLKEEEYQKKIQKQLEEKERTRQILAQQIASKQEEIKKLLEERQKEKDSLAIQIEQAKKEEEEKQKKKREAALKHKRELEEQMKQSKKNNLLDKVMSDEEKKLNAQLLRTLNL
jgi:hypothetical protein